MNQNTRAKAAHALGDPAPQEEDITQALVKMLKTDPYEMARSNAAWALLKIAPQSEYAIRALVEALLKDPESSVRARSAWALGKIAPSAEYAIDALIEALKDPEKTTRSNANLGSNKNCIHLSRVCH